jgi:hypothetical protein
MTVTAKYLDLGRQFAVVGIDNYSPQELAMSAHTEKTVSWPEVLENRFSVIMAPANYGKTTELREQSKKLRAGGTCAIFIELRSISGAQGAEEALDEPDLIALRDWKAATNRPLTLFIDSLDESALGRPDDLKVSLRKIGLWIGWPLDNINWVISTRPAVLSDIVIRTITEFLQRRFAQHAGPQNLAGSPSTVGTTQTTQTTQDEAPSAPLNIYTMRALTRTQGARYLQEIRGVENAVQWIDTATRHGLKGLTNSPGGLDILTFTDLIGHPPQCLSEAFNRVVDAASRLHGGARVQLVGNPTPESLLASTEKLALASTLCQRPNIELPQDELIDSDSVLPARLIVNSELSDKALDYLLGSQLFIDTKRNQVKVYPEELHPFLAARHLSRLIKSPEQAHRLLANISWEAPTGESGVYQHLLAVGGWLATLNHHCRELIIDRDPQAAAFFGDMRSSSFPLSAAKRAMRGAIRRVAIDQDTLGRRTFGLTAENYWQAGPPALGPVLIELFRKYGDSQNACDALIRIATHSGTDALRQAVLDAHGSDYTKVLGQTKDALYLVGLGQSVDLAELTTALLGLKEPGDGLLAALLPHLAWKTLSAENVAALVSDHLLCRPGFRVSYTTTTELIETGDRSGLYKLARVLFRRVLTFHRKKPDRWSEFEPEERVLDVLTKVLSAVVEQCPATEVQPIASLCVRVAFFIDRTVHRSTVAAPLRRAIGINHTVRRAMLRTLLKIANDDEQRLERLLLYVRSSCPLNIEDAIELQSPLLEKILTENKMAQQRAATAAEEAKSRPSDRENPISEETKAALSKEEQGIRDGTATNALQWIAQWLLTKISRSRYGEVSLTGFKEEVGQPLASAASEGLRKFWRNTAPLFDQSKLRTMYTSTIAGLQGLHLELGEGLTIPTLSEQEVRRAIEYSFFEINGFPAWIWRLIAAYPETSATALATVIKEAENGPLFQEHAENLLVNFPLVPKAVASVIASLAWDYIEENEKCRPELIDAVLKSSIANGLLTIENDFVARAIKHITQVVEGKTVAAPVTNDLPNPAVTEGAAEVWASHWLGLYPRSFTKWLTQWRNEKPEAALAFAFRFADYLGESNNERLRQLALNGPDGLQALSTLYDWIAASVKPDEDLQHAELEIFSVGGRDRAESVRNSLIGLIASVGTEAAYATLGKMGRKSSNGSIQQYIKRLQFDLQERRHARPAFLPRDFSNFERDLAPPISDYRAFALALHSDLLAVKYQIEHGECSLRRFFSKVDFTKITTDKAGLALENDFQALLGRELEYASNGRYAVTLEARLPEGTKRDILLQRSDYRASIELKMSQRWTVSQYVEALESQLVGQYMRARNSKIGFFVVVLQKPNRTWKIGRSGRKISFPQLIERLKSRALHLEEEDSDRFLRIIGIDATEPPSFRTNGGVKAKGSKA